MQRFMHFYGKKLHSWPETGTRGLIDLLGAEDVKRTGVENLAGGSTSQLPPRQLAPC